MDAATDGLAFVHALLAAPGSSPPAPGSSPPPLNLMAAMKCHQADPCVSSNGLFENYLTGPVVAAQRGEGAVRAALGIAQGFSDANLMEEVMRRIQAWELGDHIACVQVGCVLAARRAWDREAAAGEPRGTAAAATTAKRVGKFNSAWSKDHNRQSKLKGLKLVQLQRAAKGLTPLDMADLGILRTTIVHLARAGDWESARRAVSGAGLDDDGVLALMRLWGGAKAYPLSLHARVKKNCF